jgi:hypothetical protein
MGILRQHPWLALVLSCKIAVATFYRRSRLFESTDLALPGSNDQDNEPRVTAGGMYFERSASLHDCDNPNSYLLYSVVSQCSGPPRV